MAERERLEYLRGQLRAESISYGELHELQSLAAHIEPGDVELLEAAGVPEFPDAEPYTVELAHEIENADDPLDAVEEFIALDKHNANYIVSQGDRRWIVYLPEGTVSELPSRSCLPPKGAALTLSEAITELRDCDWPSVAEDLEDGVPPYTVLRRLSEIGEEGSVAYEIVSQIAALQPEEDQDGSESES